MVLGFNDYRSYLKSVLADKKDKNSSYSMRAFAQAIGISQAAVSQIFSGKKNLSAQTAMRLGHKLGLSDQETEYFVLLVQYESAKDARVKEALLNRINQLNPKAPIQELSLDFFRVISDWYHLVIRNMTEIKNFKLTPKAVAKRLGITPIQAEAAIERLLRLELIAKHPSEKDHYVKTEDYVIVKSASPHEALRNFHRQMLEKAIESLTVQTPKEKIIGSETFAFSERDMAEANSITEAYFQKMAALSKKPGNKSQVYHLGVQFFNVTKEGK